MKTLSKEQMEALLTKKGLRVIQNDDDNTITVDGESGDYRINYYSERSDYIFGIEPKLNQFVEDNGWFFEWYDAGTLNLYPSF